MQKIFLALFLVPSIAGAAAAVPSYQGKLSLAVSKVFCKSVSINREVSNQRFHRMPVPAQLDAIKRVAKGLAFVGSKYLVVWIKVAQKSRYDLLMHAVLWSYATDLRTSGCLIAQRVKEDQIPDNLRHNIARYYFQQFRIDICDDLQIAPILSA
jgi:hypothetical protein